MVRRGSDLCNKLVASGKAKGSNGVIMHRGEDRERRGSREVDRRAVWVGIMGWYTDNGDVPSRGGRRTAEGNRS